MSSNGSNNNTRIWTIAGVVGVIAFLVLKFMVAYHFWPALLLAILIAILVAILLWIGFYRDVEGDGPGMATGGAGTTSTPASASTTASTSQTASTATGAAASGAGAAKTGGSAAATTAHSIMGEAGNALKADKASTKSAATKKPAAKTASKSPAKSKAKPATKAKSTAAAKPAAKSTAKATATKTARPPVAKDGKPETLKKARAGGADDLKLIKGVGPGLEKTLNEMGFYHYDQVAGWRKKEIEWVDSRLKFKGRIERDDWVKQAKTLAKGGSTEFSKRAKKG